MPIYAQVIIPLAINMEFTYVVPPELESLVATGRRVEVQFGAKRIYSAIVRKVYEADDLDFNPKPILNVMDKEILLHDIHLTIWDWVAHYYMATLGEVMNAALPSAFKLSSTTRLYLNPTFNEDFSVLDDREFMIAEALHLQKEISISDAQEIVQLKNVFRLVKSLIEKGVILIKEELVEKYTPKKATFITLNPTYENEEKLKELFEQLEKRARKQLLLLMSFLHFKNQSGKNSILQAQLLKKAEVSSAVLNGLVKKGIFQKEAKVISRLNDAFDQEVVLYELSDLQIKAYEQIKSQLENKSVVLLHGVTSSGKTQVFIKLIKDAVAEGKQVLYLLPEIALTTQMISRLRKVFGNQIGVYHSKFNDAERIEIWHKVRQGEYKVVVGARSAVFLPFKELGLVIVDEEHDPSFKQYDPAPRYHARDVAIYLAHLFKAKTVLGSATPSLESFFNATKLKKYGIVTLSQRYGGVQPPIIELASIKAAKKKKQMKSHFTLQLLNEIKKTLANKEQVILFQNRRGYAPYFICNTCGWIPECDQCDVSLTYHKYANELRCHYCGKRHKPYSHCDKCGSHDIRQAGFGTEKIEDELQMFIEGVKVGRLDLETARTKKGFERIIEDFQEQKLQVLVGTQMVTKGLDFDNVGLVGIMSADHLINFPDFRSIERAFQLMLQVSGRAGRRKKQGKVLIQANNTHHPVLQHVIHQTYLPFFTGELFDRRQHLYPPFIRMVQLTLKHKDRDKVNKGAFLLAKLLRGRLGKQVLGPTVPLVSRIRNFYIRHIVVKLDKKLVALTTNKYYIAQMIGKLKEEKEFKSVIVQLNIDP